MSLQDLERQIRDKAPQWEINNLKQEVQNLRRELNDLQRSVNQVSSDLQYLKEGLKTYFLNVAQQQTNEDYYVTQQLIDKL